MGTEEPWSPTELALARSAPNAGGNEAGGAIGNDEIGRWVMVRIGSTCTESTEDDASTSIGVTGIGGVTRVNGGPDAGAFPPPILDPFPLADLGAHAVPHKPRTRTCVGVEVVSSQKAQS